MAEDNTGKQTGSGAAGGFIPSSPSSSASSASSSSASHAPSNSALSDHLHRIEDKTSRIEDKYSRSEALLARIENKHSRSEELLARLEQKIEGNAGNFGDLARQSDLASFRSEVARQSDLGALRNEVRNIRDRVRSVPGTGAMILTSLITAILTVVLLIAVQRLKLDEMAFQKLQPYIKTQAAPAAAPQ